MRRGRFLELDPRWAQTEHAANGVADAISFECPEADGGCQGRHVIPVSPDRSGAVRTEGQRWQRTGELGNLTLGASVRCSGACRWHGLIANGEVTFCADSKSGPDWADRS